MKEELIVLSENLRTVEVAAQAGGQGLGRLLDRLTQALLFILLGHLRAGRHYLLQRGFDS